MQQVSLYGDSQRRASFTRFSGGGMQAFTWSKSKLIVEKVVGNNNNQYVFDVSTNVSQSNTRPNQILLAQADLFIVTDYALYLDGRTVANQGNIIYNSFPNPDIATVTGCNATDINAFFSAKYIVQVDQYVYVPQGHTSDFLSAPVTQDTTTAVGPLKSGAYPSSPGGLFTVECVPNIFFSGQRTNQMKVTVNLNAAGSAVQAVTGGTEVVLSAIFNGFLVSGAATQWEALNALQPYSGALVQQ